MSYSIDRFAEKAKAVIGLVSAVAVPWVGAASDVLPADYDRKSVGVWTTFAAGIVFVAVFLWGGKPLLRQRRLIVVVTVSLAVAFLASFLAMNEFCVATTENSVRRVKGYEFLPVVTIRGDHVLPEADLLSDYGNDPNAVWTSNSLATTRLALFLSWLLFCMTASVLFACAAKLARREPGNRKNRPSA